MVDVDEEVEVDTEVEVVDTSGHVLHRMGHRLRSLPPSSWSKHDSRWTPSHSAGSALRTQGFDDEVLVDEVVVVMQVPQSIGHSERIRSPTRTSWHRVAPSGAHSSGSRLPLQVQVGNFSGQVPHSAGHVLRTASDTGPASLHKERCFSVLHLVLLSRSPWQSPGVVVTVVLVAVVVQELHMMGHSVRNSSPASTTTHPPVRFSALPTRVNTSTYAARTSVYFQNQNYHQN